MTKLNDTADEVRRWQSIGQLHDYIDGDTHVVNNSDWLSGFS